MIAGAERGRRRCHPSSVVARPLGAFALLAVMPACAAIVGLSDYTVEPDPGLAADGGAPIAVLPAADGGAEDAPALAPLDGSAVDGSALDGACRPGLPGPSLLVRAMAAGEVVVDGDTSEWPCAGRLHLDHAVAADGFDKDRADAVCDFAFAWEKAGLAFMAEVHVPGPLQTLDPTLIYLNDGLELYIGSEPSTTGVLTKQDVHFVLDHENRARLFGAVTGEAKTLGIATAVVRLPDGFAAEAFVPAAAIGKTALGAGMTLGLDLQVNQHLVGIVRHAFWLYQEPIPDGGTPTCGLKREPACDARAWGKALLSP